MAIEKCTECGSRRIGRGVFSGYANMTPQGRWFASSKVYADVCSDCGLIISMHVASPEKFAPK